MPTRVLIAAVVGASLAAWTGAASGQPSDDRRHCADARQAQRRAWGTREPAREQPPTTDGAQVRHWPTAVLGTWVVELAGTDRAALTLVTPATITRVSFDDRCAAATSLEARPRTAEPRFSDADLAALLEREPRGVIHLWSPHMPLSVDAIDPLTSAARRHGLTVDLVLDPSADRSFAARIARERGLPPAALRVADSVELQFRDALVHAPSILVYAGGAIAGSVYPGGHTLEEYSLHFTRVLTPRR